MWTAGFRCSKSQFALLLRNPLYVGRIPIPAWGAEPEEVVPGRHEPIIDASVWATVQRERYGPKETSRAARRRLVPELPLRGHLLCPRTGVRLTGSASRSRSGARVWYYHGQGTGTYRLPAVTAHEAFAEHLRGIRLAPPVADLLRALADERGAAGRAARRRALDAARVSLDAAEARLLDIDTRFLDGDLDRESRDRLLVHFRDARDTALLALDEASAVETDAPLHLRYAADVLSRLPAV